jgi:hypothetical protein
MYRDDRPLQVGKVAATVLCVLLDALIDLIYVVYQLAMLHRRTLGALQLDPEVLFGRWITTVPRRCYRAQLQLDQIHLSMHKMQNDDLRYKRTDY